MISKEDFVKSISAIQKAFECENELNDVFKKYGVGSEIYLSGMCADAIVNLLHIIFGAADEEEWISYFCFDLNFGKDFQKGTIVCVDGSKPDMFTAEDLYDFLIEELENDESSDSMD